MQLVWFGAGRGLPGAGRSSKDLVPWGNLYSEHTMALLLLFPPLSSSPPHHWLRPDVPAFSQYPQSISSFMSCPLFDTTHCAALLYFVLVIVQNMFIGWAHDSNKTQDMREEILLTGEEITAGPSAQLVFTTRHPLGLLLHILALGCATHTASWVCPITGGTQVVHGGSMMELLACVSGSKPSCCIISLCFSLTQALCTGPAMTWTSRWDVWSRPDFLELGR